MNARSGALVGGLVVAGLGIASGALLSMARQDGFPHEEHIGLFPTCLGCHRGVPAGHEAAYYSVRVEDCSGCHDGQREETVDWTAPSRHLSNLEFSHVGHAEEVAGAGDQPLACASCHALEGQTARMAVGRARPESCTTCHAHEAPEHLSAGVDCASCHRPLVEARELEVSRLAAFPEPSSHEAEGFLLGHGATEAGLDIASCAVCHARQTCLRCHLNAASVEEIGSLPPDPRVEEMEGGKMGEWPEPASHEEVGWEFGHGDWVDPDGQACATCHAEASCRTCHGEAPIAALETLPSPAPGEPGGVEIPWRRPPGHPPGFATQHGSAVAANLPKCSACHAESECADCHERAAGALASAGGAAAESPRPRESEHPPAAFPPEPRPGYHVENFILRHGAEAFAVQSVCSDCHSTEVFCRDCHQSTGVTLGAGAGAGGAFHDASPNWFFEHGRAARQGLESCASCHQQTSCLRCHSAKSGLRVSPHGPGFDPDRVAERSTISCGICHFADQILPP